MSSVPAAAALPVTTASNGPSPVETARQIQQEAIAEHQAETPSVPAGNNTVDIQA